ncbi:hypothetical protein CMI48_03670 [Candidatus Pacearchaeota archaeon]|nr:hypothetical protein [Candidatus Pacearchaeota archaeon]|tara:strand:- start:313 stop:726 length:414 start_codon:yes stop_codon:yes gene_type:complete
MVNQRGIIRILEAMVAILLIIGVLLFISGRQQTGGEQEITEVLLPLLDEVARNDTLRALVVMDDLTAETAIEDFLRVRVPNPALDFGVSICDLQSSCGLAEHPRGVRDIFVAERVVSSTLRMYQPRRVKLFLWERPV